MKKYLLLALLTLTAFGCGEDNPVDGGDDRLTEEEWEKRQEEKEKEEAKENFKPRKVIISIDSYRETTELDFGIFGYDAGDPYFIIEFDGGDGFRSEESRIYNDMESISNPFEAEFSLADDADEFEFSIGVYDSDATEDDMIDYTSNYDLYNTHTFSISDFEYDGAEESFSSDGNSEKSCRLEYTVRVEE